MALLVLLGAASTSRSQGGFTTVTGTITDPNGVKYACGTISAQLVTAGGPAPTLNGGGFTTQTSPVQLGCPTVAGSGASGSFAMRLADSGVIVPSTTTWRFTVNISGNVPPLGTGPQSFTFTSAINCSTNTPATCTSNTIDISSNLSAVAPALFSGVTGGITATSTPNVINPTLPPFSAPLTLSCANLNVTLTSGSNVVACSTAAFTSADIGKVIFASCCGGNGGQAKASSVLVVAQGVIHDIISPTSVHVCTTTGTCTPVNSTANSANGTLLYWGFKADTQVQAAIAQVYAGPGPCEQFFWSGILMVSQAFGNGPAGCIAPIGATGDTNLSIQGTGRANSLILMSPDFNFSSCTGAVASLTNVCFFALQGVERKYFGINGGGRSNTGSNNVTILASAIDTFDWDIGLSDIGAQDTAMVCYSMNGAGAYPNFPEIDGCGNTPIDVHSGQWNNLVGGYAADVKGTNGLSNGGCMQVESGAIVNSFGFFWGAANSGGAPNCVNVNAGGKWNSNGDWCLSGSGTNCVINNGGTARLHNFTICGTAVSQPCTGFTPDHGVVNNNAAALTYITQSNLVGTVNSILNTSGTIFIDPMTTANGANSGVNPTCTPAAALAGAGSTCSTGTTDTNEKGTMTITAAGAPGSAGNVTLTFNGANFTSSGVNPQNACTFVPNNTGTGTWNARASFITGTVTAAAHIKAADNNAANLAAGSTYKIDYLCEAK